MKKKQNTSPELYRGCIAAMVQLIFLATLLILGVLLVVKFIIKAA